MGALLAVFVRDVRLSLRAGGGAAQTIIFFGLTIVLYGLGLGPDRGLLAEIAAPAIWISALLSSLLALDRIFQADFEDGSLDIIAQRTPTLALLVLAKAAAHWASACLPLIIAAPVAGLLLSLPPGGYGPLALALLVGSPALSLLGALGAAITFPTRRAGVLMTILTGPLFAPVVIFGVTAAEAGAADAAVYAPSLLFLAAGSLISLVVAPLAGAAAIRFNLA